MCICNIKIQIAITVKIHWTDNKAHVTKDNADYEQKTYYVKISIRQYER